MLVKILGLYFQGLVVATVLVSLLMGGWIFWRAIKKRDKTLKDRQAILYEAILMGVMIIPILSFAMMGIMLLIRV